MNILKPSRGGEGLIRLRWHLVGQLARRKGLPLQKIISEDRPCSKGSARNMKNLWIKCPVSGLLVFYKDVEANQFVIPGSNHHMRMGAVARLKSIFDNETWFDVALPEVSADPLKFRDERKYADRIKDARARTGLNDAIKVGYGKLEGAAVVIAVQALDC